MASLRTPFQADSFYKLFSVLTEGKYQQLSPEWSDELKEIISMMLQVDPQQRINAFELTRRIKFKRMKTS